MCGIVGILPKGKSGLFSTDATMFSQMLFADQLRGTDGTGVIYNDKEGIKIIKEAVTSGTFMSRKHYRDSMEAAVKEGHFLLGHNRAATKGSLQWKNTHPFREGNIILMHNGTLHNHDALDKDLEVDSHAICKHMSIHGAEETLKLIDGAFSLIWVNLDDLTINLARNWERPMTITDIGSAWMFSSEGGLARWVAERNKKTVISSIETEAKKIYTFSLDDPSKYTEKPVEYFVFKYKGNWSATAGHTNPQSRYYDELMKEEEDDDVGNVVPFKKKQFNELRKFGEVVMCVPVPLPDCEDTLSAILHDDKRGRNFVLCKIYGEPETEIRIYGKYRQLVRYCNADLLQGNVTNTIIQGKKTTYWIENVITHKSKSIAESKKDKKESEDSSNDLDVCTFCRKITPKEDMILYFSNHICPDCADLVADDRFNFGSWKDKKQGALQ